MDSILQKCTVYTSAQGTPGILTGTSGPILGPLPAAQNAQALLQSATVNLYTVLYRLERKCFPDAKEGPQAAGGLLMESLDVSMVAGGSHGMRMGMPGTKPLPLGMLL